jgi:hypothetical protein
MVYNSKNYNSNYKTVKRNYDRIKKSGEININAGTIKGVSTSVLLGTNYSQTFNTDNVIRVGNSQNNEPLKVIGTQVNIMIQKFTKPGKIKKPQLYFAGGVTGTCINGVQSGDCNAIIGSRLILVKKGDSISNLDSSFTVVGDAYSSDKNLLISKNYFVNPMTSVSNDESQILTDRLVNDGDYLYLILFNSAANILTSKISYTVITFNEC